MIRKVTFIISLLAILFVVGCQTSDEKSNSEPTPSSSGSGKVVNTEDVYFSQAEVETGLDLQNNGKDGNYVVNLLTGDFDGKVEGTILSDTDCEPDKEGVSRCLSYIRLTDESLLQVSTPHNMKNYRCFQINEEVSVTRNEANKVVITLHQKKV